MTDDGPDGLDAVTRSLLQEWELSPRGPITHPGSSMALRVQRRGVEGAAGAAVLRRADPATTDATEHVVLRRWAGNGSVRLLAADPVRAAVLVEDPAPGVDLTAIDLIEACEVLGGMIGRLAVPAPPQLVGVAEVLTGLPAALHRTPDLLPRRMVDEAIAQARALSQDTGTVLTVPTALDFRSVVTAARQPHLTTSGLALAGDPALAVAAAVWDRPAETARAHRVRTHLRLRVEVICDVAGIDPARARAFTVVRTVARITDLATRGLGSADDVTTAIGIVKAMQG